MADIDKLVIEVDSRVSSTIKNLNSLIDKLSVLDGKVESSAKGLTTLSKGFRSLSVGAKALSNLDMGDVEKNLTSIYSTVTNLGNQSPSIDKVVVSLKGMANALNGLANGYNKISNLSDISGGATKLTSQMGALEPLSNLAEQMQSFKTGSQAFNSALNSLQKGLEKLPNIIQEIDKIDLDKFTKQVAQLSAVLSPFIKQMESLERLSELCKNFTQSVNSTSKALNVYSKSQKLVSTTTKTSSVNLLANMYMMRRIGTALGSMVEKINSYIENLNLFSVALEDNTKRAWEFVESLQAIGVDQSESVRYVSTMYDMAKSMGMTSDNAYTLSTQLTKLAYDYASFYNIDVDNAFEKLQAGIVGSTKPLRELGKDVTEATLKVTAMELGIAKSVENMTQLEKAELRFISIMQQSASAMNDMERTLYSPANALRVLKAQFTSLVRTLGNLFVPMLSKMLPYLIATVKFINELVKSLARMVGITLPTIDFNASQSNVTSLGEDVEDTTDAITKLKNSMLGIDELNVLSDSSSSGVSGITDAIGGLGLDLELYGYNELLQEVDDKAKSILDTLMKWKTPILAISGILAGLFVGSKVAKFITTLMSLGTTTGKVANAFTVLGTAMGAVGLGAFATGVAIVAGVLASLASGAYLVYTALKPAIKQIDVLGEVSEETQSKLDPLLSVWKDLDKSIKKIDWSNKVIDNKDIEEVTGMVKTLVNNVLDEVDSDRNQALQDIEMLRNANSISNDTYRKMISDANRLYDGIVDTTTSAEKEITKIMTTASKENRSLKQSELERLNELQMQIRDNMVSVMSETESEYINIMNKLKLNATALKVEEASEILKSAKVSKENQIKEAQELRDRMLYNLNRMYGDEANMSNTAYAEQYKAIQNHYDGQVKEANQGYDDINTAIKEGLGESYNLIDSKTGEIKKVWQVAWERLKNDPLGFFKSMLETAGNFLGSLLSWFGKLGSQIAGELGKIGTNTVLSVGRWFASLGEKTGTWFTTLFASMKTYFSSKWTDFSNWSKNLCGSVASWFGNLTTKFSTWVASQYSSLKTQFNTQWNAFSKWSKNLCGNVSSWFGNLGTNFGNWISGQFTSIKNYFKKQWDSFTSWTKNLTGSVASWFSGLFKSETMQFDAIYNPVMGGESMANMGTPTVTAFARGGFVPQGASFMSPQQYWTAGEAGREVVGNYNGRTTVMPLEDTGFVQAMREAVYSAVVSANQSGGGETSVSIEMPVYLDSKEIYKGQEDFKYRSGTGLIRKVGVG